MFESQRINATNMKPNLELLFLKEWTIKWNYSQICQFFLQTLCKNDPQIQSEKNYAKFNDIYKRISLIKLASLFIWHGLHNNVPWKSKILHTYLTKLIIAVNRKGCVFYKNFSKVF